LTHGPAIRHACGVVRLVGTHKEGWQMRRVWTVGSLLMVAVIGLVPSAFAERRPIKQLPVDVVRWSTLWVNVPKEMVEVGQEYGPLAALTWGPTKGTAVMIESTTEELWKAMKPDKRSRRRLEGDGTKGLIFRYEF